MNLNIDYLCKNLAENTQEILDKIHKDSRLIKRFCNKTNLWIANAGKDLFTPEYEHQLYAKGIVYEIENYDEYHDGTFKDSKGGDFKYKLVSIPFFKIYNFEENILAKTHVNEMITMGTEPIMLYKADGTWIGRFVYNDKVYIHTRGMLETMAENDEQKQYFNWAWDIINEKYPKVADPEFMAAGTSMFELVGPDNQIVTHYPSWDLIMTGFCVNATTGDDFEEILGRESRRALGLNAIEYYDYNSLVEYNDNFKYGNTVNKLYAFGNTLEEQIKSINTLFSGTDDEGSVIQFEVPGKIPGTRKVVGRIKAKTDTYRQLLKLMNNCNFDAIAAIIDKESERFIEWETFETYLKSLGSANYPEELMNTYKQLHNEYWTHRSYCRTFVSKIAIDVDRIIDESKGKIKFEYDHEFRPKITDKKSRAEFAEKVKSHIFSGACFSWIDGKLTEDNVRAKMFTKLEESKKALEKLGYEIKE